MVLCKKNENILINKIKNNKELITTILFGYIILLSLQLYALVVIMTIILGFLEIVVNSDSYLAKSLEKIF